MLTSLPFILPFALAVRNMSTRRWRTLLTMLGIVLGVAVVLAIQITNHSTLESIRQVFDRAAGQASLLVVPLGPAEEGLDEDLLGPLEQAPEVEVAAPSVQIETVLASQARSFRLDFNINGLAPGTLLFVYGIDPQLDSQVRVYELLAGRMPDVEAYEAAIPQSYADEQGLEIGDDLVIITRQGEARLEIVGLLDEDGVGLINDGVVAFAPLPVVQELFEREGRVDEIALRVRREVSDSPRALDRLKETLQRKLGKEAEVAYPAARGQLVPQMLATYQQGLAFFSVIAIFVGGFLIYNTFSMTVVERTREIGMLRAIGMNRFQVLRLVLAEAVLLSLAGSAAGLALGVVLARSLMVLMGAVVSGGDTGLVVPPEGLVQSLLVGIGVTFGSALIPAYQAARTSPLEALRARARSGDRLNQLVWLSGLVIMAAGYLALYQIPWRQEILFTIGTGSVLAILLGATLTVPLVVVSLERQTRPLARRIYGNEGSLGSANIRRSLGRTTLTVAALMVALTMVISIGSLAYSFETDITSWIETAIGGDLYVRSPVTMRESFSRELAALPGVAAVSPARYITVRVSAEAHTAADGRDEAVFFNAIDPDTYREIGEVEFATGQGDPEDLWASLLGGNVVFISTNVADRYNIRQGDVLWLLTPRGEHAFQVAAEMLDFSGQGGLVMGTYADLHRYFGVRGVDRFTVRVAEGHSIQSVAEVIEERFAEHRHVSVQTTQVFKENIRTLMDQSFRLFDVLNLIGVFIGALGVINTLTMNVIERQQEIGGLRSLGMTRGQVLRMVLAESLAMGFLGGGYGVVFGFLISQVLIYGMNLLNGYELVYVFTAVPLLVGLAIALVVSQAAALYPGRKAARVNIVEAIKQE